MQPKPIVRKQRMSAYAVRLPTELKTRFDRLAEARGQKFSDLVRDAMESYERQLTRGSTAWRLRKQLGVFAGPSDLATHSKHMKGFGT